MNARSVKLPKKTVSETGERGAAAEHQPVDATLVREILDRTFRDSPSADAPTCADLASDHVGGVASGRTDLATNREHLEQAVLGGSFRGGLHDGS